MRTESATAVEVIVRTESESNASPRWINLFLGNRQFSISIHNVFNPLPYAAFPEVLKCHNPLPYARDVEVTFWFFYP